MTEIEQRLDSDVAAAARARAAGLTTLRSLKAALQNEAIAKRAELAPADVTTVLRRELKRRQEAAKLYLEGGRPELAAKETEESALIQNYLPQAPTAEELEATAMRLRSELKLAGPQAMGQLTKAVIEHYQGAADGQSASAAARAALQ